MVSVECLGEQNVSDRREEDRIAWKELLPAPFSVQARFRPTHSPICQDLVGLRPLAESRGISPTFHQIFGVSHGRDLRHHQPEAEPNVWTIRTRESQR